MTGDRRLRTYVAVVLLLGLAGAPALYFGAWAARVSACRRLERADSYLAYCDHPEFGSYEHAAYRYGLEPEAARALAGARALLLGNSRLQHAFSTAATDAFFTARGVPYHLLGFGYGESSRFARALLERDRPAPLVVIINADPFLQDVFSPVAYAMTLTPWGSRVDGLMKHAFDRVRGPLCRLPGLCSARAPSVYRDRRTGQWIWADLLLPRDTVAGPVGAPAVAGWAEASLPAWTLEAGRVLALLPTRRDCILLTGVPTPAMDAEGLAAALGRRLGLPVIQPVVPDLATFDGSHLSAASAERWSAAFLAAAAPRIDACVRG